MEFREDERAQSVVIGSLLVFTIILLSFSGYQAFVVPNQNEQVEIDHAQTVKDQFAELRTSVVNAVGSDTPRSTNIDLGPTYPTRTIALNPPPAAGKLQTRAEGKVSIEETGNPDDVNVCSDAKTDPTTRSLVYTPSYNEFRQPESVGYESRVVSRQFRDGSLLDQRLVQSGPDEINLYLLNGSVDENGIDTYSLEVNASRQYTTTLKSPRITIPSRFDKGTWNTEILTDPKMRAESAPGNRVKLLFNGGDYEVSCAVVGLDSDPKFTPPDDDGGGGSSDSSSSDGAYDVRWVDPTGEPGTTPSSCSEKDCTLDADQSQTLDLTAETVPTAQDANVDFSVSDSDVATITPFSDDTGSDGKVSARMRAQSNGKVKVYTAGGGSGDVINVTIKNCPPWCGTSVTVVYTRDDNDNNKISIAKKSEDATDIDQKGRVIGPLIADIDGDGNDDIPYVNKDNDTVHIVDPDGTDEKELSSNNAFSPSLLGVGRWDENILSVYFASEDKSTIYRTNPSEGDIKVVEPRNGVAAVAGPADIDDDDANELVYADGSQELRYFDPGAGPGVAEGEGIYDDVGSENSLGRPADFNSDGTVRIPVVDGSGYLALVDINGDKTVLVDSNVAKSPVAAVDWDDDGDLEIMYLTENGNLKYVDNVTESDQTVKDTGIDEPRKKTGVT